VEYPAGKNGVSQTPAWPITILIQNTPNHATYETTIITMTSMIRTLYIHPSQMERRWDLQLAQYGSKQSLQQVSVLWSGCLLQCVMAE
jgi:hypothetical protein